MEKVSLYVMITAFVTTLILACSIQGNLIQAFGITNTGCPINSTAVGFICSMPISDHLPIGIWKMYVNGINGTLDIAQVDNTGGFKGNMTIDSMSKLNGIIICPKDHPCSIQGHYDIKSGKISFTSTATIESFVPIIQFYTGHLSKVILLDFKKYALDGTGITISPAPGYEFGWHATKGCVVTGGC